jgi:inorganic pyrophosphatase
MAAGQGDEAIDSRRAEPPPGPVRVTIEITRGSFLKRGSEGQVDFISPLPCPFNYGSIRDYIGGEGDYLDAVVLGPPLPRGSQVELPAWGAVGLAERGLYDDKLICARGPVSDRDRRWILRFFHLYAWCKGWYNRLRGYPGDARCTGWSTAGAALARAQPARDTPPAPRIHF